MSKNEINLIKHATTVKNRMRRVSYLALIWIFTFINIASFANALLPSTANAATCTPTALSFTNLVKNQTTDIYTVDVVNASG